MPEIQIKKALNRAFIKVRPERSEIEKFKNNLINLLDTVKNNKTEGALIIPITNFLNKTYYDDKYFINQQINNMDLVILNGINPKEPIGVIFEAKHYLNKKEMISKENINTKALQQLLYYFLGEAITNKNDKIKHLIITDGIEWYIFNAEQFNILFIKNNKKFVKDFIDYSKGSLLAKDTNTFYTNYASPQIEDVKEKIEYVYFNINDYEDIIRNNDKAEDNKLISLYKLLSPENLLKLSFENDSNILDNNFYNELLYIMGLCETEKDKKLIIDRNKLENQIEGSLIENVIFRLENTITNKNDLFEIALELVITWINRILFLKLLESQLLEYNNDNKNYLFLNSKKLKCFDDLNILFFKILALQLKDRPEKYKSEFQNIPYLNSSLFDVSETEKKYFQISNLKEIEMPIYKSTVLKDHKGQKRKENILNIDYIFEFLEAYDFSSEGSEKIIDKKKTLINASVLGLIFEKINGYKEGSYYTPGLITTYICKEAIRKIVINKFNEVEGYNAGSFNELKNYIDNKSIKGIKEANDIINSIKICDPAVGSGHFLVSALNEFIAIKSDLKILANEEGIRINDYSAQIINDELLILNENGDSFKYNKNNKESQNIQKTIFNEKRKIIEGSLFGVDININSVKICNLRLWIELLKNSYYTKESNYLELETLPNLDINIKCGNSLINRFELDIDLKDELSNLKYSVNDYKEAVRKYKNAFSKNEKEELVKLITLIKEKFTGSAFKSMELSLKKGRLERELKAIQDQKELFDISKDNQLKKEKSMKNIYDKIKQYELQINNIENNIIFENAFEWRLEFPELLNDDGDFIGFDGIIGNPPYVYTKDSDFTNEFKAFINKNYLSLMSNDKKSKANQSGKINLYGVFIIRGVLLCKSNGILSYIIPNNILRTTTYDLIRKYLLHNTTINEIVDLGAGIFQNVTASTIILQLINKINENDNSCKIIKNIEDWENDKYECDYIKQNQFKNNVSYNFNIFSNNKINNLISKIKKQEIYLGDYCIDIIEGIVAHKQLLSEEKLENTQKLLEGKAIKRYGIRKIKKYIIWEKSKIHRTRPDYLWTANKKIILQRISGGSRPLIAALDTKKHKTFASVNNIVLKKEYSNMYEVILALINSSTLNWYYANNFSNNSKLTVNITKTYMEKLPIPIISDKQKEMIENIVNKIIESRNNNIDCDISKLENKIDKIIYELFNLNNEDIDIIENNRYI